MHAINHNKFSYYGIKFRHTVYSAILALMLFMKIVAKLDEQVSIHRHWKQGQGY